MQLILSIIKDYGVILGSILTVFLTSILVTQRNEIKKNRKIIAESLTGSSGALYISMKNILNRSKVSDLSRELDAFFEKYANDHASIVKLKDKRIIIQFLELEELYYDYLLNKNSEKLDEFMIKFVDLKNAIEKVFYAEHRVVNKDMQWHLIVEKTGNIWFRLFLKCYKFISHTIIFSVTLTGFMMYLIISDKLLKNYYYENIYDFVIDSFMISVLFFLPILIINLAIFLNDEEKSIWLYKFFKFLIPNKLVRKLPFLRRFTEGDEKVRNEKKASKEYENKYKGRFTMKGGE
ncbi:hypothetical protein FO510_05930 [Bacillus pumilus]|uniref:hypothetical protein n=1 Tax=Bacillus pumilus TaxID=1408 RepID=UPI00017A5E12|nr:hypothetical protein [Bacillus pumilus]EDW22664.1 hypothetical protein BAT_0048 [Bacillus pumilus ATCC 7061]MBU8697547.1 hypothetical protein [Bacillus pumilus]MCR4352090.1 hypothetical protein [Bacillus pumilus]MCY7506374.1 hypothetical protein [Bacillus pumilus]MDR4269191.1 hypothetical protein [Bacillus pumilus]